MAQDIRAPRYKREDLVAHRSRKSSADRSLRAILGGLALIGLLALFLGPTGARGESEVDLELVLAVDASGSVDETEFRLQLSGIAAAFRDPAVLAAIEKGFHGRIAVALQIWAESAHPKDASPWRIVADGPSAARFADLVETYPRRVAGGTGIGAAILHGVKMIERNGIEATRRVMDISGDGEETTFREFNVAPWQARHRAVSRGVTINGLAILSDDPNLESYYRREIISGPGAFTLAVQSYADFASAMRQKLIREIEARPQVSRRERAPSRRSARLP